MSGHLTERDLLKWSTSLQQATKSEDVQSQLTPEEIEERKKRLDPKWIDVILGRTDAMRMRGARGICFSCHSFKGGVKELRGGD